MPVGDLDGDNIPDEDDDCPETPEEETANSEGCSPSQIDTDNDTVYDDVDICPNTPLGEIVNEVGCSSSQTDIDTDGDGVNDVDENADQLDMCPNTLPEDYGEVDTVIGSETIGCAPSQLDTDGDSVSDDIDQCPGTTPGATVTPEGCIVVGADTDGDGVEDVDDAFPAEPTQWDDTDGDGFGDNWADPEWNASHEEMGVGDWVASAATPDSCPKEYGESNNSASADPRYEIILGCVDSDGDGWADSIDWEADDGTQWIDHDEDGFGDNPNGVNGDQCVGTKGVGDHDGDGEHENGCPPLDSDNDGVLSGGQPPDLCEDTDNATVLEENGYSVDANGCADNQRDSDDDFVKDHEDLCPNTPEEDNNIVDDDGCTPEQLLEEESSSLMDGPMLYVAIGIGSIVAIAILLLVISRIRGSRIDWDEEDDDDDYLDDDDDDDWDPFGSTASTTPTQTFGGTQPSHSPPSTGPATPSRGPPFGGDQSPPTQSRGPPTGPAASGPPGASIPRGPSRTPRQVGPGARPSAPTTQETSPAPAAPVRKTRRTAAPTTTAEEHPVRKTRKTSRSPATETSAPTRKTRRTAAPTKTTRRRKSSASFDDLFGPDEKADFDTAVISAKERLIVGDSEQSVLARLQSEGWNVKQSKHILGQARP